MRTAPTTAVVPSAADPPPARVWHPCHGCDRWLTSDEIQAGRQVLAEAGCDLRDAGTRCVACAQRWASGGRLYRLAERTKRTPDWWRRRILGLPATRGVHHD